MDLTVGLPVRSENRPRTSIPAMPPRYVLGYFRTRRLEDIFFSHEQARRTHLGLTPIENAPLEPFEVQPFLNNAMAHQIDLEAQAQTLDESPGAHDAQATPAPPTQAPALPASTLAAPSTLTTPASAMPQAEPAPIMPAKVLPARAMTSQAALIAHLMGTPRMPSMAVPPPTPPPSAILTLDAPTYDMGISYTPDSDVILKLQNRLANPQPGDQWHDHTGPITVGQILSKPASELRLGGYLNYDGAPPPVSMYRIKPENETYSLSHGCGILHTSPSPSKTAGEESEVNPLDSPSSMSLANSLIEQRPAAAPRPPPLEGKTGLRASNFWYQDNGTNTFQPVNYKEDQRSDAETTERVEEQSNRGSEKRKSPANHSSTSGLSDDKTSQRVPPPHPQTGIQQNSHSSSNGAANSRDDQPTLLGSPRAASSRNPATGTPQPHSPAEEQLLNSASSTSCFNRDVKEAFQPGKSAQSVEGDEITLEKFDSKALENPTTPAATTSDTPGPDDPHTTRPLLVTAASILGLDRTGFRVPRMERKHPSTFQQLEKLGEGTYATVGFVCHGKGCRLTRCAGLQGTQPPDWRAGCIEGNTFGLGGGHPIDRHP